MWVKNGSEYEEVLTSSEDYPKNRKAWEDLKEKIRETNQPECYILASHHMASHACNDNGLLYMLEEALIMIEHETKTLSKVLHAAAVGGNLSKEVCLALLQGGADPNYSVDGRSVLDGVVVADLPMAFDTLIKHGVDVHANSDSALVSAAIGGNFYEFQELMKMDCNLHSYCDDIAIIVAPHYGDDKIEVRDLRDLTFKGRGEILQEVIDRRVRFSDDTLTRMRENGGIEAAKVIETYMLADDLNRSLSFNSAPKKSTRLKL